MSDEEEYEEEVEEVIEEEAEEVDKASSDEPARPRPTPRERLDTIPDESTLTEAEKAMLAAKRRHEDDDAAKLADYEDRRRVEREREEEELRLLKERQEQRRQQREEEERAEEERRKAEEERRHIEEEERRAKFEGQRKKKEQEKERKRQQMMANFATPGSGGRNFILPEKKDHSDKFGNIVQAKQEMGMTKDQREETKMNFLAQIEKNLGDVTQMGGTELRGRIKEMHQRICKLEAEKYDLEKRVSSQEYDLKELNERQRQINRSSRIKGGADPNEANSRFPPKVQVMSKYDRQIDRRNFTERRSVYENKRAFPCFPNVGPPPTTLEFRVPDEIPSAGPEEPSKPLGEEDDEEEEE